MVKFYVNRIVSLDLTLEEYEETRGTIPAKWRPDVVNELTALGLL